MTDDKQGRQRPRTTPSEAVGESGDEEARREADEAAVTDGDGTEPGRANQGERPGGPRTDSSEQSSAHRE
ncbi:hypothetical protein J7E93_23170 [Streptomyces sp. ISL-36]|uniref:hypothetical protein n=1 Tax=Streptomyces sp. ISL-36 TaxID=2819182 RepID=UPI001BE68B11|nr:hypothetical protein [Streptomyces sp. ISL-36]MBT2442955.1 hypothetical protein [Streptomyces sp. ISL-36]